MNMIVVRNAAGFPVAYGPAGEGYDPVVPVGCTVAIEHDPDLTPQLDENSTREAWKAHRAKLVGEIVVTSAAGNTFDGDEVSQGRMARAIVALQSKPADTTTTWVLADNTAAEVTAAELLEALQLAGQAQTDIWTP